MLTSILKQLTSFNSLVILLKLGSITGDIGPSKRTKASNLTSNLLILVITKQSLGVIDK